MAHIVPACGGIKANAKIISQFLRFKKTKLNYSKGAWNIRSVTTQIDPPQQIIKSPGASEGGLIMESILFSLQAQISVLQGKVEALEDRLEALEGSEG